MILHLGAARRETGQPVIIYATTNGRITSWRDLDHALAQANSPENEITACLIKNEDSTQHGEIRIVTASHCVLELHVFGEKTNAERLFNDLQSIVSTGIRRTPVYAWFSKHGHFSIRCATILAVLYRLLKHQQDLQSLVSYALMQANNSPRIVAI